jgi:hypothetical protein
MLSERDLRYLGRLRGRRYAAIAAGVLLTAAGGFYAIWGAGQFRESLAAEARVEQRAAPRDPVARLARLFAPYHERLRDAQPETEAERVLIEELDEQTTLTAQLLVLLVRFLFASLVLTTGLILLSNALVTGRLLSMLDTVLEQQKH